MIRLGTTGNTETERTRPGLVLSINAMNRYSPRLIIAPITSRTEKIYPFEFFIPAGVGGLDKDSKVMLDQIRSLDKKRLLKQIGVIDKEALAEICIIAQKLIAPPLLLNEKAK